MTAVETGERRLSPLALATAAVVALAFALVVVLASGSLSILQLLGAGDAGPSSDVIAHDFDEPLPYGTGYDGQQNYAIARYFPDLDAAEPALDEPRYRILRILPPAIASIAPAGPATAVGLLVVNLAGVFCATWGAGRLLEGAGSSVLLALLVWPPLLLSLAISTTEPVAWGLAILALSCVDREQHRWAIVLLIAATLSRETSAVVALVCGAVVAFDRSHPVTRRIGLGIAYGTPAMIGAAWYVVAAQLVGGQITDRFHFADFAGLHASFLAVDLAAFIVGIVGAWTWRDRLPVALVCLVFSLWMFGYTATALEPIAITRVNGVTIALGLAGTGRALTSVSSLQRVGG